MEGTVTKAKHLDKERRELFYQSKYDYYKNFNKGLIFIATMAYITFFLTDCGLYGRFATETVLSRVIVLVPLVLYLILFKKQQYYKIMVVASYLMIHIIIWCTDWATYILPDRTYAEEGMMVMNTIFVCAGFCAPYKYAIVAHMGLVADILIANIFIRYADVTMMIMFNLPCIIGVCIMHYFMENVYLEHYLVNERLHNLVVYDQLTGVYNRNQLKRISNPDTEELTIGDNIPITLLIVDLDFFKKVNDQYGHEGGDVVLKHTVGVISKSVRSTDYIIRWGGEEFVIILAGCDVNMGMEVAEKIRTNIEASENGLCPITASIGVASYQGGSYHSAVERADKALYRAKTSGRNKVIVYDEE